MSEQPKHCGHECVCAVLAVDGTEGDTSPCDFSGCQHDTRSRPHTSAQPSEAQQRIDAVTLKILRENIKKKEFKPYMNHAGKAVWFKDVDGALLQAGEQHE